MSTFVQEQMFNPGEELRRRGTEGTRHLPTNWRDPQAPDTAIAFNPRVKQLERLMAFDISDECGQLPCKMDE